MAPKKTTLTMVKMVSMAKTGYHKWFLIRRKNPVKNLILYDPIAQRRCLFEEDKKRKVPEVRPLDFLRRHR